MPLQNRVDPYGALHATPARGAWMGNRGRLHDAGRRIDRPWQVRRWITCVLTFKDRKREVFAPNRYSELFFLDEATSLAAGHRPCAECRRARYEEFRDALALKGADEIDRILHAERLDGGGGKRTYRGVLSSIPDGTMVEHDGRPHLVWRGTLRPWSFAGYAPGVDVSPGIEVEVLTPPSVVAAIRAGFIPQVAGHFD
jgi:hypothetical protein